MARVHDPVEQPAEAALEEVSEQCDEPVAQHAYLFEVDFDADGPHVRYGMDVSGCTSDEYRKVINEATVAGEAAQRLGAGNAKAYMRKVIGAAIKRDKLEGPLARAGIMFTRARITGGSLYLFVTEVTLTFEEIDRLLQWYAKAGMLKDVLERARVE